MWLHLVTQRERIEYVRPSVRGRELSTRVEAVRHCNGLCGVGICAMAAPLFVMAFIGGSTRDPLVAEELLQD